MELKKAPKRQRNERGCISRTYLHYVVDAIIYDRAAKCETVKQFEFTGSPANLAEEKLVKTIRDVISAAFENACFLDYELIKAEEVRYYMTESDFIAHAEKAE